MSAGTDVRRVPRGRLLLLGGGGVGLLIGMWTGLGRAGMEPAFGPLAAHGVIMVLGFLGTLIALERAVAMRARWSYGAPALSAASVLWLLAGLPPAGAGVLLTAAGVLVSAVYLATLRRHFELHLAVMAGGACAWVVAAALWSNGWSPVRLTPMLAAFLVLTIVGERVELSRLRRPSARARRWLAAAVGLFGLGAAIALIARPAGLVMIEALACGTPVLAFKEGAAPEIVQHGVTGFLCSDEQDMVEAIAHIGELDRRACRAAVEGHFSLRRMVDDHVRMYQRLVRGDLSPTPVMKVAS